MRKIEVVERGNPNTIVVADPRWHIVEEHKYRLDKP